VERQYSSGPGPIRQGAVLRQSDPTGAGVRIMSGPTVRIRAMSSPT
jgi:hypothetical protein